MPSIVRSRRPLAVDDDSSDEQRQESSTPPQRRGGIRPPNGRASVDVDGDEEMGVGEEDGEEEREVNGEENGEHEGGEEEEGEEEEEAEFADNYLLPADDDELDAEEDILDESYDVTEEEIPFQTGAIVRITLKHFVTYNFVEIWPGPSLNMIIGPNGTGKSTLVCAICLGLGYSTNVLGRAKDISSFVKHGAQEAHIEIELQGKEGERNPVIARKISRANNSSVYYIHGGIAPRLGWWSRCADMSRVQAR